MAAMSTSLMPDKTLEDLAWSQVLEELARRTHTRRGERRARELPFLDSVEVARQRLGETAELRVLHEAEVPPPFGSIVDIGLALARADKGAVLEAQDLKDVGTTLVGCARLARHLTARSAQIPAIAGRAARMPDLAHVSDPLVSSFEENDVRLADHASEDLGRLRKKALSLHDELVRRFERLLNNPEIEGALQDKFFTQREERYVIPLRSDSYKQVDGIVHGSSNSGQTLFVEPEQFVELNNRLKLAQAEIVEEEQRIYAELSSYVAEDVEAIRETLELATAIDVLDAAARLSMDMDATEPVIDDADGAGGELQLTEGRHPTMSLSPRGCVPNDLALGAGQTLVVSGPNAGGKTVALKTMGLAVLMVRAGLHVAAADGSRVPWVRTVHTDVGDAQSIERDLSTFSAHIHRLREIIEDADADTLVLIDEVAVGTAPEQGAALAQAVLERVANVGARTVVTTHYERVKAIAASDPRFVNAAVGFDMDTFEPTFKLAPGAPGSSGGLMVARRLGLPEDVTDRAADLLGEQRSGVDELLDVVNRERRELEEQKQRLAELEREAEAALRQAEFHRQEIKRREDELKKTAHTEAVAALREARAELDRVKTAVKKKRRKIGLRTAGRVINELGEKVAEAAPAAEPVRGTTPTAEALDAGTAVYVVSLGGARGRVAKRPEADRVDVQVGTMHTNVPLSDLRLAPPPAPEKPVTNPLHEPRKKKQRKRRSLDNVMASGPTAEAALDASDGSSDGAGVRTIDNTLDVRGERVTAALGMFDRFVDESLLSGRDVVFVIHGHGTGALRDAVREHGRLHPSIERLRGGDPTEGGDGVTVVWIDAS